MKNLKVKKIAIALAITSLAGILSGCGNSSTAVPPAAAPVANTTAGVAGCIPISQPIGFSATNMVMDSTSIRGGIIPNIDMFYPGQQFGQVVTLAGGTGGPYTSNYVGPANIPISADGIISMNIVPATTTTTTAYMGGASVVTATGTITLSATKQQAVSAAYGYNPTGAYNPYMPSSLIPTTTTAAVCVNSVAISIGHNNYNLYSGRVYLYLNSPTSTAYSNSALLGSGHGTYMQL
jgi:hypothetical protein